VASGSRVPMDLETHAAPFRPCSPDAVVIASAGDEAYALPLAACVYSAVANYRGTHPLHVLIIDAGLSERSRSDISRVLDPLPCHASWRTVPDRAFDAMPVRAHISRAAYARLTIPELVDHSVRKVIYLDSDTIVEGDLAELWAIDVGEHALAAVQDAICPLVSSPHGIERYRSLGLQADTPYFNSGVLVVNVPWWRERGLPRAVLEYVRANRERLRCLDQEGLNAVLAGRWLRLDSRWNRMVAPGGGLSPGRMRRRERGILHFISNRKPWLPGAWHPLYRVYDGYRSVVDPRRGRERVAFLVRLWTARALYVTVRGPYRRLRRLGARSVRAHGRRARPAPLDEPRGSREYSREPTPSR